MKTLVIGAEGFIGRTLCRVLGPDGGLTVSARVPEHGRCSSHYVDLLQPSSIAAALAKARPDVVINCAGVATAAGSPTNTAMTGNLLQAVLKSGIDIRSIVICGSAAAYGHVNPDALPVPEAYPLAAFTVFGLDKVREESLGRLYRYSFGIPVVTARIFHPIGTGMSGRHFLPSLCRQLQQWKAGRRERLEVNGLDATHDYVSATDVARALSALAYGQPREAAYNIGSGMETSNGALLQRVFALQGLSNFPPVDQTSHTPEPALASQADISAMSNEFGWTPQVALDDSILEVLDETARHQAGLGKDVP
ncbi:NAD(P)-dependent oxidoreductase [Arthrobacter sp. Z1-9]